jgi:RHS repeat-associated protein
MIKRHRWFTTSLSVLLIVTLLASDVAWALKPLQSAQVAPGEPPDPATILPPWWPSVTGSQASIAVPELLSRTATIPDPLPPRTRMMGEILPFGPGLSAYSGSGALTYEGIELVIPSRGLAFQVSLDYHSLYREQDDGWGYGWAFDYDWRYEVENDDVIVRMGRSGYFFASDGQGGFISSSSGVTLTQEGVALVLAWSDGRRGYFESPVHGQVTRLETADGETLTFAYDGDGHLETISDATGRQMTFSFAGDRLHTIADEGVTPPRRLQLGYGPAGDLVTLTNALSQTTVLNYDVGHRLTGLTDPRSGETHIIYAGDYVSQVERGDVTTTLIVDEENHTITVQREMAEQPARQWIYAYDHIGVLERTTYPDGTSAQQTWDDVQKQWRTSDENGHTTIYFLDAENRLGSSRDSLGHTTTYTYHPTLGLFGGVTDPNGHTTIFEYDEAGQMIGTVDPLGRRLSYGYNAQGDLVTVTDPLSRTSRIGYDASGALTVITDALGVPTVMAYDAAGRWIAITDGDGHTTRLGYDALDRLVVITDALGHETTMAYDGNGNLVQATDPNGHASYVSYDELDRPVVITDALGGEMQFTYDAWGNPTALTDARGHTSYYEYDARDRMTSQTDPLSRTISYRYDAVGNRIGWTDARGQVIGITYDAANQLTAVDYPGDDDVYVFYDPAGQVTAIGDADLEAQYTYDAAGGVVETVYAYDGVPFDPLELIYGYDVAGQLISTTLPGGELVQYEYDGAGRLAAVEGGGTRHELSYDDGGRLTEVAPAVGEPGAWAAYTYDAAGRITASSNASPDGSVVWDTFEHAYDPAGNVLSTTHNGGTTSYVYDALNQLTEVSYPDGSWERHTYDSVGNRLALETPTGVVDYVYDAADQLQVLTDTQGGLPMATAFTYDENGNLRTRTRDGETIQYTWDAADRLTRIDYDDATYVAYTYGPEGQRLSRRGRDGDVVYYVYDGLSLVEERDGAGGLLASYVHGQGLDRPYSMSRGGQTYFYLYDRQGSVVGLSDGLGNLVARYEYDAWGNPIHASGTVDNPFRYAGREWDPEAGLYYNRARYYDPALGRFLSPDPLGSVDGTNRYVYVSNNPTNYVDSLGTNRSRNGGEDDECSWCDCFVKCMDAALLAAENWFDVLFDQVLGWTQLLKDPGLKAILTDKMTALKAAWLGVKFAMAQVLGTDDCVSAIAKLIWDVAALVIDVATVFEGPLFKIPAEGTADGLGNILGILSALEILLQTTIVGQELSCIAEAIFNCEDMEPPVVTVEETGICNVYRVTATDNCTEEDDLVFDPSTGGQRYVAEGRAYPVYVTDEEGRSGRGLIPACKPDGNGCRPKPKCPLCIEATWESFSEPCKWWCPSHEIPPLDCGCDKYLHWNDDDKDNFNCYWECLDKPNYKKPPKPACRRDRCGNQLCPEWDEHGCKWVFPDPPSNNPCPADDNRSPAGLETPVWSEQARGTSSQVELETAGLVWPDPTPGAGIAILDNGFSISLHDFLARLGFTADRIAPDFSPEMVNRYPVLLVPSGGLNGYAASEAMRQRLARYVENGGTLIVFAQVYGDEFRLLPGGQVDGYGWDQDINCHSDSAYLAAFAPMLWGQYQERISLNIDGYFTHWPLDAAVLLNRAANGMPAMLSYPYGAGRVVVTTAYADMASYLGQGTYEERVLVRDLLYWAGSPDMSVGHYEPHDTVTAPLTITNQTGVPVTYLVYNLFDPWEQLAASTSLTLPIPLNSGESTQITLTLELDALVLEERERYGLWSVDVVLLDSAGDGVQGMPATHRFAVTRFTGQEDGYGYPGKPYALSVTSESETYPSGSPATFGYHVFNHSDQEETFRVTWAMVHEGDWRNVPGAMGDKIITVAAHSVGSFAEVLKRVKGTGRVSARLYLDGKRVAYAERGFWVGQSKLSQSITTDDEEYGWRERPVVTVTTRNHGTVPIPVTAKLATQGSDGQTVLADTRTFTITPGALHVYTLTLPPLVQFGYTDVSVVNQINGLFTRQSFKRVYLAPFRLPVAVELPAVLAAGAPLALTVANEGDEASPAATLQASLTGPTGATVWSDTGELPVLESGQAGTYTFTLGDLGPIVLGDYVLSYRLLDAGYAMAWGERTVPARLALTGHAFDRPSYSVRETVRFTTTMRNYGYFDLEPTLNVSVPDIGYTAAQTVALPVDGTVTAPLTFTLPTTLPAGDHTVWTVLRQGDAVTRTTNFYVSPASIQAQAEAGPHIAGQSLPVTLTNSGGVDAWVTCTLALRDLDGQNISIGENLGVGVLSGQPVVVAGSTPITVASGDYRLKVTGEYTPGNQPVNMEQWVIISGADARASAGRGPFTAGQTLPVTFTNPGSVDAWVTYTLKLRTSDGSTFFLGEDLSGTLVTAGGSVVVNGTVPIEVASGSHHLRVTARYTPGDRPADLFQQVIVSGADVRAQAGLGPYLADGALPVSLTNHGSVDAVLTYTMELRNSDSQFFLGQELDGISVPAHTTVVVNGDIPQEAWSGMYALHLNGVYSPGNRAVELHQPVQVSGPDISMTVRTDRETYLAADDIVVDGRLTNIGTPLPQSDLELSIVRERLVGAIQDWQAYDMANSGLSNNQITAIQADAQGSVWFGNLFCMSEGEWWCHNAVLDRLLPDLESWQSFPLPTGLSDAWWVNGIVHDDAGRTWIAADVGVGVLAADGNAWVTYTTDNSDLVDNWVNTLALDDDGNAWFGTKSGANRLSPTGEWYTYTTFNSGLTSDEIYAVAVDVVGNVWFGTEDGLSKLTPGDVWITYTADNSGLLGKVNDIAFDSIGNLWLATSHSYDGGVSVLLTGGGWITYTTANSDLASQYVSAIAADREGRKWIGYSDGGFSVLSADNTTWEYDASSDMGALNDISSAPNGDVWLAIGASGGEGSGEGGGTEGAIGSVSGIYGAALRAHRTVQGWQMYDMSNSGLSYNEVTAVEVDAQGSVWFGNLFCEPGEVWWCHDAVLDRLLPDLESWQSFPLPEELSDAWEMNEIVRDDAGRTWVATSMGVGVLAADGSTWDIYTMYNSDLADDGVNALILDDDGNIWFGTDGGANRLSPAGEWSTYQTSNSGLASDEVYAVAVDVAGNVWFGTADGLSKLTPDGMWSTYTADNSGLLLDRVDQIALDNTGNVWLAGSYWYDGGISVLLGDGGWLTYTVDTSGLQSKHVSVIAVDRDGQKWIGYSDGGGSVLSADNTTWEHYTYPESCSGSIDDISFAPSGDVWLATSPVEFWEGIGGGVMRMLKGWLPVEEVFWTRELTVSLGSTDTFLDVSSLPASSLDATGRLTLRGVLASTTGLVVAQDRYPFYVFPTTTGLTLHTDRDVYRPGQALVATGALFNHSILTLSNQAITVTLDGVTVYTAGPFDLLPGEAYPYTATTIAPLKEGSVPLEAHSPLVTVDQAVRIAAPVGEATLSAPAVAGRSPFSATVVVTNTGQTDAIVQVSIAGGPGEWLALAPGQSGATTRSVSINDTAILTATVRGDLEFDLSQPVLWGEGIALALEAPAGNVWAGLTPLLYTITNTGMLPLDLPFTMTLDGIELLTRQVSLSAGRFLAGEFWVEVEPGHHVLTATTPYQQVLASWTAHALDETTANIDDVQSPAQLVGRAPLTVTLTNPGPGRVDGTLQARTSFYLTEIPLSLDPGETRALSAALDSEGAPAGGTYTLTVEVWANGMVLDRKERVLEVPALEWRVETPPLTLVPGVENTVPFAVHNAGGLGAPFTLTLDLDGLIALQDSGWVGAGAEATVSFTLTPPADLDAITGIGHYDFNGAETPFTYTIAGYQLDMRGRFSSRVAQKGQTVTATVWVTDTTGLGQPIPLWVRLTGAGDPQTTTFTLTNAIETNFVITAPEQDALFSYGVYHPDGRSLLLDTLRLYVPGDLVRIYPDRARYHSGEIVTITAMAQVTGTLTWQSFDITGTLPLTPTIPRNWTIPLADDLLAGTYRVMYLFEMADEEWVEGEVAFDVEGDRVEVHRVLLDREALGDQEQVSATLQLRGRTALTDVVVTGAVIAPDGTALVSGSTMADLQAGGYSWVALPPLTLDFDQLGLYRLDFHLAQGERELASGWEGFDVAGSVVVGVNVPQDDYLPSQPVTVSVALMNDGAAPATLTVELNDQVVIERTIADTGYLVEVVDLGMLPVGVYTITARLTDGAGRTSQDTTQVRVVLPQVQVEVSSPSGLDGWHVVAPFVQILPEVEGSLVYYRWDDGVMQQTVHGQAEVPADDGQHGLVTWAEMPGVGAGPVETATVWLDRTAPQVTVSVEQGMVVTVSLLASDSASGVDWIGYLVGQDWMTYTAPLTFTLAETTTVLYQAHDRAGNSSDGQVDVPPVAYAYDLALAAYTTDREGPPGGVVAYTLRVTNTGVAADTYNVMATADIWPVWTAGRLGPLDPGCGADLVVAVNVPPEAAAGASDVVTVTVRSEGNPTRFEQRLLTTTAQVMSGVAMDAGRTSRTGVPDSQASYWLRVTNLGNVTDIFDVTVTGNDWPTAAPLATGPLGVGASEDLNVIVEIPAEAETGQIDAAVVTAVSGLDPTQSASIRLATTVICLPVSGAEFTYWPPAPQVGEVVRFSGTIVAGTPPVDYTWGFGDGHIGSEQEVTHTYTVSMTYQVVMTATNCAGAYLATHQRHMAVIGGNVAPIVDAGPDQAVEEGDTVFFAGSFTDPDAEDTHTIKWDFGDGGTATGALTATHVYAEGGVYTVTLTVTDSHGAAGSDTLLVTVESACPCPVEKALRDYSQDAMSYRDLRDEVFAHSVVGLRYAALYEQHAPEVARILAADPRLAMQATTLLRQWRPAVDGLVATQRGGFLSLAATQHTVTDEDVAVARALLTALDEHGSPTLRADLERVFSQLDSFAGHTPMEIWVMLTQGEQRIYLPILMKDYTSG